VHLGEKGSGLWAIDGTASHSVSMLCCEGCMNHECYSNDWEGDQRRGHAFSRLERPSATDKPESPHSIMR
jgi:hypothetical protein